MSFLGNKRDRDLIREVDWEVGKKRTFHGVTYLTRKDFRIARQSFLDCMPNRLKSRFGMAYRRRAKAIRGPS